MCGMVMGLVGGLIQGIGAMQSANAAAQGHMMQSQAYEMQAQAAEMQARQLREKAIQQRISGAYQGQRKTEEAKRIGGQQRAAHAEGGLHLTGSAADVAFDTGQELDLDIAAILWNSKVAAQQSEAEAAVMSYNADIMRFNAGIEVANAESARSAGPLAFLAPVLSSAASFAGSFV